MSGAIVLRDLLGIARFPVRAVVGVVATTGVSAIIALGLREGAGAQLVTATAAIVLYFAVGVWCEGLRFFGATIGGSSPYGISPTTQVGLHLVAPLLISVPLAAIAAAAASEGCVFPALKGTLPISLLMPVPSPIGDLSVVNAALWLADAVTIMALIGGGLTISVTIANGAVGASLALAVLSVLMGWWAQVRLGRLARP
ncbi:hypothetical protein [Rathayibacter toxicus]|uniref:hypothetical protein n=1 Tax=Rathayibacter toxicus TaxID=145458 RepID=UPI001C046C25|nr:hypothetical protein [Rathayibacter toxicus]QWL30697.1 hypothetical protein E2R34_08110 [Rathayibacter toxicus]